jgi:hypothetical protein
MNKKIQHLNNLADEDKAAREYYAKLERADMVSFMLVVTMIVELIALLYFIFG